MVYSPLHSFTVLYIHIYMTVTGQASARKQRKKERKKKSNLPFTALGARSIIFRVSIAGREFLPIGAIFVCSVLLCFASFTAQLALHFPVSFFSLCTLCIYISSLLTTPCNLAFIFSLCTCPACCAVCCVHSVYPVSSLFLSQRATRKFLP